MRDVAAKLWERVYPYVGAILYGAVATYLTFKTEVRVASSEFDPHELWAVLVGIEAGAVGILFSVFVFTMAPAAGFVEKMTKTKIFPRFIAYVKEGLVVGILAAGLATPLAGFTDSGQLTQLYSLLGVVASVFAVCSALTLYRVGRIFLFWASRN